MKTKLYPKLEALIPKLELIEIPQERKNILTSLINYIQEKISANASVNLIFICTHNSRRSQFSQVWAKTFSDYFEVPINSLSGGVEVTHFNERAITSLQRSGFKIHSEKGPNAKHLISYAEDKNAISCFSKLFDDEINQVSPFAAIMTCSDADQNCPFIPGTEKRIALNYEDPKAYDGAINEAEKYDERSMQIASEMFYVFSNIRKL